MRARLQQLQSAEAARASLEPGRQILPVRASGSGPVLSVSAPGVAQEEGRQATGTEAGRAVREEDESPALVGAIQGAAPDICVCVYVCVCVCVCVCVFVCVCIFVCLT